MPNTPENMANAAAILKEIRELSDTVKSIELYHATNVGKEEEREGVWAVLREVPTQLAELKMKVTTLENSGAVFERVAVMLFGAEGFFRSPWGLAAIAAVLLVLGVSTTDIRSIVGLGGNTLPNTVEQFDPVGPPMPTMGGDIPMLGASMSMLSQEDTCGTGTP